MDDQNNDVRAALAAQQAPMLADWEFDQHDDEEGRTWLSIRHPSDAVASVSVRTKTGNGDKTIAAQVLTEFVAAIKSAQTEPAHVAAKQAAEPVGKVLTEAEQNALTLRDPVIWFGSPPRGQTLYAGHAPATPQAEPLAVVLETLERVKAANPEGAFFTLQVLGELADKMRATTPPPVQPPAEDLAPLPTASPATKGYCNDERCCVNCYTGQGTCLFPLPEAQAVQPQGEPMQGLASWLRMMSSREDVNGGDYHALRKWAAEVDLASRAVQPMSDEQYIELSLKHRRLFFGSEVLDVPSYSKALLDLHGITQPQPKDGGN